MLLPDDVMYHILLWLPVISLLRFKSICKSWCVWIESNDFMKHHLHRHHYDPRLKDKNHNLIYRLPANDPPITFSLTSIDSFETPNVCLQLDRSDLHGYFPIDVFGIVSFNGILCMNLYNCKKKQNICLWNPATKQSRFLPQSPFPLIAEMEYLDLVTSVGFGFDVKTGSYKVVNLIKSHFCDEKLVEVYDLSMDSWKSITTVFPVDDFCEHPKIPFNNGTCFCWKGSKYSDVGKDIGKAWIMCFDFSSEMLRSLSYPNVGRHQLTLHLTIVDDKIACVLGDSSLQQTEIWVFNEYGSINESWAKLYTIDIYSILGRRIYNCRSLVWLSMSGKYIFFKEWEQMCRYDVVTKELKNVSTLEKYHEIFKDCPPPDPQKYYYFFEAVVEFKESLVSVGGGHDAAPTGIKKSKKKRNSEKRRSRKSKQL